MRSPRPVEPDGLLADRVAHAVAEHEHELVALRRQLHAHPELSGHEVRTTEDIAGRLRVEGLRPRLLAGGTGLVCDVDLRPATVRDDRTGPAPVPTVVLRADIDALAMADEKDVAYRSRVPGVAHACGHDVHVAVVVGAALALLRVREDHPLDGRVRLVFEPAEETVPGGAVDVLAEGWLDDADAVFGVHCDPKLDLGRLGVRTGPLTAASDSFEVRLHGPGGHTARPHLTVDLVRVAGLVATELPARVGERAAPYGRVSVVFGAVHAGDAANVIPATALLRGSLRTPDRAVWDRARDLLEAAVADLLSPTGARWQLVHTAGVPPVVNDGPSTDVLATAGRVVLGSDGVVATPRSMGGDSFAWYLEKTPGSYARLGVHDPDGGGERQDLHSATFDVDERAIGIGARILALAALTALR